MENHPLHPKFGGTINNPATSAQTLLKNPDANVQPVQNNPGVAQQLISSSNPGAGQQHISTTPGADQAFINKPSTTNQAHMMSPGGVDKPFISKPSITKALMMSPNASNALIRADRGGMLNMSDDNVMMKQILTSHAPDGREFDVRPLLYLVEDILNRATQHVDYITKVYNTFCTFPVREKWLRNAHLPGVYCRVLKLNLKWKKELSKQAI